MTKHLPDPEDFFKDATRAADEALAAEERAIIEAGLDSMFALYRYGIRAPQSLGARWSFRDWDWMTRTAGRTDQAAR